MKDEINYTKLTPIELQKRAQELRVFHENVKNTIVEKTIKVDEIEKEINSLLEELKLCEEEYVKIISEIDKR